MNLNAERANLIKFFAGSRSSEKNFVSHDNHYPRATWRISRNVVEGKFLFLDFAFFCLDFYN